MHFEDEDYYLYLLTTEDFRPEALESLKLHNNEEDEEMTKNDETKPQNPLKAAKMSLKIRRALRYFADSANAREIILLGRKALEDSPNSEIRPIFADPTDPLSRIASKSNKCGLFATRPIKANEFILVSIEAFLASPEEVGRNTRGRILHGVSLYQGLKHDFGFFDVVEVPKEERKRKRRNSVARFEPAVKRGRGESASFPLPATSSSNSEDDEEDEASIFEKYIMCVDFRTACAKSQAIRRNCRPNCIIQYVLLDQRMEIFITAIRDVEENEELTIAHDFDYFYSTKMLNCAHYFDAHNLCEAEINRRNTIQRFVDAAKEQRNAPTTSQNL